MSQRALAYVRGLQRQLPDNLYLVMRVLAEAAAGPEDEARLSYRQLTAATGLQERQLRTLLYRLKDEEGLLTITKRHRNYPVMTTFYGFPRLPRDAGKTPVLIRTSRDLMQRAKHADEGTRAANKATQERVDWHYHGREAVAGEAAEQSA